ncbi:Aldedh-domain-containing protein [Aspergillus avenaceus]|uniref:aldehyde dehydrogenase (NAD(+)) n=1 Tax=Aspergillus avenaceus TaxID=36643 RepID=A0A5N6TY58_ASPAV|nr:Aldedh-domain-containing protein [Aspergillus avenaceus]
MEPRITRSRAAKQAALLANSLQQAKDSSVKRASSDLENGLSEDSPSSNKNNNSRSTPKRRKIEPAGEFPHNLGTYTGLLQPEEKVDKLALDIQRTVNKTSTTPFPEWLRPTPEECEEVASLLSSVHGPADRPATIPAPSLTVTGCGEVPTVLDALVRTLLSGATSGNNSALAFDGLVQKFGILQDGIGKGSVDWNAVRQASVEDIFDAIKSGGLANIKSKNIKAILDEVYKENGEKGVLSLNHLHDLDTKEAMVELTKYPGIGPKTAACVLLFCLQRPCFAVDTHIFRICKWLGWVPPTKVTEVTAYSHLEVRIPDHLKYSLHQLFIWHGKSCPRCRAITGEGSAGWDQGCVIDHLVTRSGKKKGGTSASPPPRVCTTMDQLSYKWGQYYRKALHDPVVPEALTPYVPPALLPLVFTLRDQIAGISVALASVAAVYLGCVYLLGQREAAVTFNVPIPPEVRANWTGKKWEDAQGEEKKVLEGQLRGSWSDKVIMSYCPADGRILGNGIKPATTEDVDRAIQAAKKAQVEWSGTSFADRRKVLKTLLKYVLDHQDDLVTACCLDSGKTKVDASFGEILVTAEKLKWTIDHGEKALAPESRPTNFLMMYKKNMVTYEPLGVVSACVSWNYPFHNFIGPIISGIFAGNGVVVKPSEQTAWSSAFFLEVVRGALSACGHSRDLVQSVVCLPKVADFLTSHPDISQLTFIGSKPVAHKVCESAAKALIPVTVELGGKDPSLILDDARTVSEVSSVASLLMRGVFQSAGQNCIGVERVVALPGVYDKLLAEVSTRIEALRLGSVLLESRPVDPQQKPDTPDMGAVISPASFDRLESLIDDAVRHGARLVCGGKRYNHPKYPHGHYFAPTLLADVTPSMQIAQTELFAPVFLLMRADSVPHAIAIANSTIYALGASVFGYDGIDVASCVSNIKAGMVSVNDFGSYYAVQLPFGGVKGSGYGRFAGEEGLRGVCNLKSVCVDRFPRLMATRIPPRVDYPIYKGEGDRQNGTGAWEMCKGVVETGYQLTLAGRFKGIIRLLTNM